MNDHYDVFIGNLPTTVSTERLRDLFSYAGKINHIWINRSFEKITYGFIGFANLYAAEEACNRFNNKKLDLFKITVRVSEQTKLKSENDQKKHLQVDFDIENIKTGYICKDCKQTLVGYYLIYHEKKYFRCKCKCSKWLVQSTRLNQTFDKESSVFLI